jgi:signal recognition particle GTPase
VTAFNYLVNTIYIRFKDAIQQASKAIDKEEIEVQIRMIDAMTEEERQKPEIIAHKNPRAKARIMEKSGATAQDLNRLVFRLFNAIRDSFSLQLEKYFAVKAMYGKMFLLQKQGKQIPNNMDELLQLLRDSGGISTNVKQKFR